MAPQVGAHCLENAGGGMGVLLGGVPGVPPADVVIIGGGVAGTNAAQVAIGLGADVTVVDRSLDVLRRLVSTFGTRIKTAHSNAETISRLVTSADLVISTILVPGAAAPKLITREMVSRMKKGSVLVDVAIDQGGASETSRATTHSDPTYVVDGVVHYCVANMPGGVARTSAFALNNATLPFTLALADKGWKKALVDDPHLAAGLNVHAGRITYKAVADALGFDYMDTARALAA
jgi:alanine dehydrogenase